MRLRPHRCPAALAYMSAGLYDVRPHLVSLFYSGDQLALPTVLAYGCRYMETWCNRSGVTRGEAAIRYAAADGLMRLYRPRAVMPADDRAKQLRMRAGCYRELCNKAHNVYRLRLMEGAERFIPTAMGGEDIPRGKSDGNGFRESEWWDPMQARTGRPEHPKSVRFEIGQCRSPAHLPRAPPRDMGGYAYSDWIEPEVRRAPPRRVAS